MKRGFNTTPTRQGHKKLSLKAKRPKDGFNYSQQGQTQTDTSPSTCTNNSPTNNVITTTEKQTDVFQFHSDESNLNFDVVWDDRPEISTPPVNKSRPFFQIENLLKGFPAVESPVARKQIMSLTAMNKNRRQSTPLTSKRKKNTGDITDCLKYLRDLTTILEKPNPSTNETDSSTKQTMDSSTDLSLTPEGEEQREQNHSIEEEPVLEDSLFDHSSLIQQLLSDSFDEGFLPDITTTSHHNTPTVTSSPSILAPSVSAIVSSELINSNPIINICSPDQKQHIPGTYSSGLVPIPQPSSNVVPRPQPSPSIVPRPQPSPSIVLRPQPSPSVVPRPQPSSSAVPRPQPSPSFVPRPQPSSSVLPRPQPSSSVLPRPQPSSSVLPRPQTSSSVLPRPQPSPSIVSRPQHQKHPISIPRSQHSHSHSSNLVPKLQPLQTHTDSISFVSKPNQQATIKSPSKFEQQVDSSLQPNPQDDNNTWNSDSEDDAFWSTVVNSIDVDGIITAGGQEVEETDDFLSNLDKESVDQLFDFADDDTIQEPPTKQVCSQDDIKRKKQVAKRKLQRRHKTC